MGMAYRETEMRVSYIFFIFSNGKRKRIFLRDSRQTVYDEMRKADVSVCDLEIHLIYMQHLVSFFFLFLFDSLIFFFLNIFITFFFCLNFVFFIERITLFFYYYYLQPNRIALTPGLQFPPPPTGTHTHLLTPSDFLIRLV